MYSYEDIAILKFDLWRHCDVAYWGNLFALNGKVNGRSLGSTH